jgi:hypothetical protein
VVSIRSRGTLPHWEDNAAIYFVTFRLADSLPFSVVQEFSFERRDIVATSKAMRRDLTLREHLRLAELFSRKIETHLDAGSGSCHLANPEVAAAVVQTLRFFDGSRYRLFAWCVMPNHVHVVFQPLGKYFLATILDGWKSYSVRKANTILRRSGSFWQRDITII